MRAFIMDLVRTLVANHDFIDSLHEASGDDLGGLSVPSHAADIDQDRDLRDAQGEASRALKNLRVRSHYEALAFPAVDLEPLFAPTRAIRRVRALRYNSFKAHCFRPRIEVWAILEVLAVEDERRTCGCLRQKRLQDSFPQPLQIR
jgi:hypothetical protein